LKSKQLPTREKQILDFKQKSAVTFPKKGPNDTFPFRKLRNILSISSPFTTPEETDQLAEHTISLILTYGNLRRKEIVKKKTESLKALNHYVTKKAFKTANQIKAAVRPDIEKAPKLPVADFQKLPTL